MHIFRTFVYTLCMLCNSFTVLHNAVLSIAVLTWWAQDGREIYQKVRLANSPCSHISIFCSYNNFAVLVQKQQAQAKPAGAMGDLNFFHPISVEQSSNSSKDFSHYANLWILIPSNFLMTCLSSSQSWATVAVQHHKSVPIAQASRQWTMFSDLELAEDWPKMFSKVSLLQASAINAHGGNYCLLTDNISWINFLTYDIPVLF